MNRVVAGLATLGGLALIFGGLAVADFTSDSLSAVLVDGGVALALFALLLLLERRLMGRVEMVATSTAQDVTERSTRDLRDRIVSLENLEEAQAEAREERRRADEQSIERLTNEALTTDVVGTPLVEAYRDGLFADDRTFRVRTSDRADCHVLYMLPLKDPKRVPILFFDFESFVDADEPMMMPDGTQIVVPAVGQTTCCFSHSDDARKMAGDLEAALRRANKPINGFSLRYALEQLADAARVMRCARGAESRPLRLEGKLRLLINADWAITDAGLEAVGEPRCFKVRYSGFWNSGGSSPLYPTTAWLDADMRFRDDQRWLETRRWLTQRENWKLEYEGDS